MDSLILNLQKKTTEISKNINSILYQAYAISKKLKMNDFQNWIYKEIKGYDLDDNLPDFRYITVGYSKNNDNSLKIYANDKNNTIPIYHSLFYIEEIIKIAEKKDLDYILFSKKEKIKTNGKVILEAFLIMTQKKSTYIKYIFMN